MSIFIDTSIFVALRNKDDSNHNQAKKVMKQILLGEFGESFTSDYVFDEAVTVALVRTKNIELAKDMGDYILSSKRIKMIFVDGIIFRDAWVLFRRFSEKKMSFTDCTNIAISRNFNIEYISSFDTHFDGLMKRIF